MNTNKDTKLALRRSSIRTLTADELKTAHGGRAFSDHGSGCATSDRCATYACPRSSSSW
ncbi:Bacteriocin [Smaragdicoccus niigatensis]